MNKTIVVSVLSHKFVRPEEVDPKADAIPQRFINGCNQDMREAKRRWEITKRFCLFFICFSFFIHSLRWREANRVDDILKEEQPFFHVIKKHYPHYFCGRGKQGNLIYIERAGGVDMEKLRAEGCSVDVLIRHYIFITQYMWNVLDDRELAKSISIFDVEGIGIADCVGDAMDFIKKAMAMVQEHYPETCFMIFIVNAPSIFSWVWKLIKPMVNEATQEKVHILKKSELPSIRNYVDEDALPVEYGGTLMFGDGEFESSRFHHPMEMELAHYVDELNDSIDKARRGEVTKGPGENGEGEEGDEGEEETKEGGDLQGLTEPTTPPPSPNPYRTPQTQKSSGSVRFNPKSA